MFKYGSIGGAVQRVVLMPFNTVNSRVGFYWPLMHKKVISGSRWSSAEFVSTMFLPPSNRALLSMRGRNG
ncbi:hypothetical protein O9992_24100 [Vibrio lentus]|nr:hypothetical protein [Vibrio lentus]